MELNKIPKNFSFCCCEPDLNINMQQFAEFKWDILTPTTFRKFFCDVFFFFSRDSQTDKKTFPPCTDHTHTHTHTVRETHNCQSTRTVNFSQV